MSYTYSNYNSDALKLRALILNARKPFVLRNFKMNWKCFHVTLEEWCARYDKEVNASQEFEVMSCSQGNQTPHWERDRKSLRMTLTEFLEKQKSASSNNYWIGLNYQRINEMPTALGEGIDFSRLGFSEATEECNYWLCSTQTNTPCHYDTYGCNIVVQVYGRKLWLLFPPTTPLSSTRIPYEESSVYCEENLFAPNPQELQQLKKLQSSAYRCILEANDVLIVPKHWWHYVEAIDLSLSINYWIPLENDVEEQLKECIVKILIERFVKNGNEEEQKFILNPNQIAEMQDDAEIFKILHYLYEKTKSDCSSEKSRRLNVTPCAYQYLDEQECQQLVEELPNGIVEYLSPMSNKDYEVLLNQHAKRFKPSNGSATEPQPFSIIKKAIINSVCTPAVIDHIKMEFFKRYQI
ncbi:HSPB1-associated protein 1 isoform X2 [Eurosta solidaginis]|uniref:HSPB1-associated protein 1 isoform X2 n=1 Tax=Eurosta solidaginis TaxID=178769 RepID=UPI0035316041